MAHQEYKRIVPGADAAVLFIHGIVGSPDHFRILIPLEQTVPEDWSVHNLLLPGHGATAEDFGSSSMKAWRERAFSVFDELAQHHDHVIIVAHSMGTLFALQLAAEYPEKIASLFLLGVPMRPILRPVMAVNSLKMVYGKLPDDHVLWTAGSVTLTRKLWKYLPWIPRFLELFAEIRTTEKLIGELNVPCVAWQSRKDELVSNATAKLLMRSGVVRVHILENSTHYEYDLDDKTAIMDDFRNQINKKSHD